MGAALEKVREDDLELARLCADGDERAWERFVREYRPILYRAADALDRTQGAREIADSLYAELYGIKTADGERQSLFRYYQGRSSLATWLRVVLAQRYVDRVRVERKTESLPDEERADNSVEPDPERTRYVVLVRQALGRAVAALTPRDRLRLGCYYVQELTLAETGRVMQESEATSSRSLARSRKTIRRDIERQLRDEARLNDDQIAECFASIADDPGPLDLKQVIYE
ncbi:MAG TPA: sigma-70 family RNA polymerase sigma factor [Vicinamibacterales bacterium]|nr:sigma-70 family RNA polymerase sigma factor [Vicinamibacterales bacterium]